MANQFNTSFIALGIDEFMFRPPAGYAIGNRNDCKVITLTENYEQYDVCCYSQANSDFRLADADVEEESKADIFIILSPDGSSGDVVVVSRRCWIRDTRWSFGASNGFPIFLSQTAGDLTPTAPAGAGTFGRVLGHVQEYDNDVWFDPSKDYITNA